MLIERLKQLGKNHPENDFRGQISPLIAAALLKHERRTDFRTERFVLWQKSNRSSAI
jgi:hypothetical protein